MPDGSGLLGEPAGRDIGAFLAYSLLDRGGLRRIGKRRALDRPRRPARRRRASSASRIPAAGVSGETSVAMMFPPAKSRALQRLKLLERRPHHRPGAREERRRERMAPEERSHHRAPHAYSTADADRIPTSRASDCFASSRSARPSRATRGRWLTRSDAASSIEPRGRLETDERERGAQEIIVLRHVRIVAELHARAERLEPLRESPPGGGRFEKRHEHLGEARGRRALAARPALEENMERRDGRPWRASAATVQPLGRVSMAGTRDSGAATGSAASLAVAAAGAPSHPPRARSPARHDRRRGHPSGHPGRHRRRGGIREPIPGGIPGAWGIWPGMPGGPGFRAGSPGPAFFSMRHALNRSGRNAFLMTFAQSFTVTLAAASLCER